MLGTVAITDKSWYECLLRHPELSEANFWKPSPERASRAPAFSPYFFKLKAPESAVCGFGFFASYSRLPDWLAWETFGVGNGCESFAELRARIATIRERIRFRGAIDNAEIGCVLLVEPRVFPRDMWVRTPSDWPVRTQTEKRYDLTHGEGLRLWTECLERAGTMALDQPLSSSSVVRGPGAPRYGAPTEIRPRLGQGTFRIAVTDAYQRACAATQEHSLPVLQAAHIQPYHADGPHDVSNGLLLRADLHRLFDLGYVSISDDLRLEVGARPRTEFSNGRSYYPLHGVTLHLPQPQHLRPGREFIAWHQSKVFRG